MIRSVSRKAALAGAGATLATLSIQTPAFAVPTSVHVSTVAIFAVAPLYAADAQGYFATENLVLNTEPVQSGAAGMPALVSGQFDILFDNVASTISAIDRGIDLRIILGGTPNPNKPPGNSALMKRRGDPFRTGKDLEGKIVGVNGVRGINWVLTRSWVKKTGGDPEKVQFLELPNPAQIAAIKANRIDAAYVVDPFMTVGQGDPEIESFGWPAVQVFPGGINGLWVVTPQTVAQRPDLVRAFQRVYRRGTAWINANLGTDAYYKLVSGFTKIEPGLLARMNNLPAGWAVTAANIQPMVNLMRENGLLSSANIDLRPKIFS
jgi:NitT/TauT family transport system substrate-binding protein